MEEDYSYYELSFAQSVIYTLKELIKGGITKQNEKQVMQHLDQYLTFYSFLNFSMCFPEIKRVTINKRVVKGNERINNVSFLKYPPYPELVRDYSRCGMPGQPLLYASFYRLTCLSELRPRKGDLITISTWRAKDGQPLLYCPIFKNQPLGDIENPLSTEYNKIYMSIVNSFPTNKKAISDIFMSFLTDEFSKPVDRYKHYNYLISAYISNKIFNEWENGKIEAIYYPSVQQNLSLENLAIKTAAFDIKYELVEVSENIVNFDQLGIVEVRKGFSNEFDLNTGEIQWK